MLLAEGRQVKGDKHGNNNRTLASQPNRVGQRVFGDQGAVC